MDGNWAISKDVGVSGKVPGFECFYVLWMLGSTLLGVREGDEC